SAQAAFPGVSQRPAADRPDAGRSLREAAADQEGRRPVDPVLSAGLPGPLSGDCERPLGLLAAWSPRLCAESAGGGARGTEDPAGATPSRLRRCRSGKVRSRPPMASAFIG